MIDDAHLVDGPREFGISGTDFPLGPKEIDWRTNKFDVTFIKKWIYVIGFRWNKSMNLNGHNRKVI